MFLATFKITENYHHPGPGDRVHRGGSGHGEAARIQGVPGKADGETEGGGLIWNLS